MSAPYFASCPRGIEDMLAEEAKQFQANPIYKVKGGIQFHIPDKLLFAFFLRTRLASRVYAKLQHFKIKSLDDIYEKNVKYPWEGVFDLDQTFKTQALFDHRAQKTFRNSMIASLKLKDAIADRFREIHQERPDVDAQEADASIMLRIEGSSKSDETFYATTWLDLTGYPHSHRGYRPAGAKAPLRENLAAALVMSTDWKPQSEFLMDPMCGSGTLLIEAHLIRAKIPASYLRVRGMVEKNRQEYAVQNLPWLSQPKAKKEAFGKEVQAVYQETIEGLNKEFPMPLLGMDNSAESLELAQESLRRAMIQPGSVKLMAGDALRAAPPTEYKTGVLITNPPYGERLGRGQPLDELYYEFGETLKNKFKGYRAYVFTGNQDLRKKISLKTTQKLPFFNGDIECRLLKYEIF